MIPTMRLQKPGNPGDNTVTIQSATYTQTQGARVPSYTATYSNLPAAIQPLSGRSMAAFKRDGFEVDTTIRIWGTALTSLGTVTVKKGDRVVFGTRYFIVEVPRDVNELGQELVLTCREVRAGS